MIYWDLLLKVKEEDVPDALARLYSELSIDALAEYLGVSRTTLRAKLVECHLAIRQRGGAHYRFPRIDLPKDAWKLDVAQLVALTGYTEHYCRKLKGQLRREHEQREKEKGLG